MARMQGPGWKTIHSFSRQVVITDAEEDKVSAAIALSTFGDCPRLLLCPVAGGRVEIAGLQALKELRDFLGEAVHEMEEGPADGA